MTTVIGVNSSINQRYVNNAAWPITILNGATVTIIEDITLTRVTQYFIISSGGVIINGNNHNIILSNVTNYPGLIKNGTVTIPGFSNFLLHDINMCTKNSTLFFDPIKEMGSGWITQMYFTGILDHCSSNGDIPDFCGGISGSLSSNCTIRECRTLGDINGINAGGIAANKGSSIMVACFSFGVIRGKNSGGLAAANSSTFIAISYSRGDIIGDGAGGLTGANLSQISNVLNSYSTGNIIGDRCGGIAGQNNSGNLNHCFSTGKILGKDSDGLAGLNKGIIILSHATNSEWNISSLDYLPAFFVNPESNSVNTPFLLKAYNYYRYRIPEVTLKITNLPFSSGTIVNIPSSMQYHKIITINGGDPALYSSLIYLSPDSTNLQFNSGLTLGTYSINVLSYANEYKNYNFAIYILTISS